MLYRDPDVRLLPRCFRPEGCEIEELASDIEVNKACERFIKAKHLFRLTQDSKTQEVVFRDLGLYEDPDLHMELETIYSDWLKIKLEKGKDSGWQQI